MINDADVQEHTERMIEVWNKVADGWHKWSDHISTWTKDSTMQMIEEAEIGKGSKVLDVAAGDGKQSLLAAEIVGSDGHVLSTDISENLLEFAQQAAREKGYSQVETKIMQAEDLEIEDHKFDAVICKNGLMLFGDREKAVKEIFRVLKPGGKFSAIVFSTPQTNPWLAIAGKMIMEAAGRTPPKPDEPGLFSLAQPQIVEDLLTGGGFVDTSVSKISGQMNVSGQIDFVEFLQEAPGMLVLMLSPLSSDKRTEVMNNIRQAFRQFQDDQGYTFPSEFLVLSGRKPND